MPNTFSFSNTFSRRVRQIQVSAIKQMPLLARGMTDVVSLGQGIPFPRTPVHIRRKVVDLLENHASIGKYSLQPGMPELKTAVAEKLALRCGRKINAEQEIFISAGAMEAVFTALASVVDEGDEVILFDPGYASHIEQVLFAGGKPVFVPLDEKKGWALDAEKLKAAISSRTKAVLVCNPSNPTGKVFSPDELDIIVALALEKELVVVADETYDFLFYQGTKFVSLTQYNSISSQLIACYSFSKEYSMTGWRAGYMYAPAELIEQALKVHDAVVICAPTISQFAALAALEGEAAGASNEVHQVLRQGFELMRQRLDRLPDLFSYVKPGGAHYFFPRYLKTSLSSMDFAKKVLMEAKVITIPGAAFGPNGEHHIRLSFAGSEEEINQAFDRLERWNKDL